MEKLNAGAAAVMERPRIHPDDAELARLRIEEALGVRISFTAIESTLDDAQVRALRRLTQKPYETLIPADQAELRALVEAVVPGELAALERARQAQAARAEELRRKRRRGPRKGRLEAGDARLPIGLLDDLHRGRVWPVDLGVFSVFVLTFSSGDLLEEQAAAGVVRWEGDAVVTRGQGRSLLRAWDPGSHVAPVEGELTASLGRLAEAGWLSVVQRGGETVVGPGPRLGEA
jgi:hypothetical protein